MGLKRAIVRLSLGASLLTAGAIACGSAADFAGAFGNGGADGGGGGNPGSAGNGGDGGTQVGAVSADDVLVVHASPDLPAFRLCFDRLSSSVPLPNQKLMPQSNVVGVDIGTAVHIGPLDGSQKGSTDAGVPADAGDGSAPTGTDGVYAMVESVLREQFYPGGDPTGEPSCGTALKVLTALNLGEGKGFFSLGSIAQTSIYGTGEHMLVVAGCQPNSTIANAAQKCQTGNTLYDTVKGNLHPEEYDLSPVNKPGFVTQFVQLSPQVDAKERVAQTVQIGFGPLTGADNSLATLVDNPVYGQIGGQTTLTFDGSDLGNYASYGFVAQIASTSAAESLAAIQTESSPLTVPPDFYALPSNFVVLTIGDPDISATTDPGHALHFLAVPVRNPDTLGDAGPDADTDSGL